MIANLKKIFFDNLFYNEFLTDISPRKKIVAFKATSMQIYFLNFAVITSMLNF